MRDNLYVDVHIIQDVPPANLNRDDSGSPKSARYGGVERLRVSSQAWKRAVRKDFVERLDPSTLGVRTRRLLAALRDSLTDAGVPDEQAAAVAVELLKQINITPGKKEEESAYLFYFSRPQLAEIVEQVVSRRELWADPKELSKQIPVAEILGHGHSLDVALFGRMVADLTSLNVDAACQVAHAIGTHGSATQFDYFTAVDDSQGDDEAGAGMIGTVEFSSATLYRYATVNVPALIANMDGTEAALAGVGEFVRSFALSMPTGKQNTFAAHTRPALVLVQVRGDQPVNYVSAFETPVKAGQQGYVANSVSTLCTFIADETVRWGDAPLATLASYRAGSADAAVLGEALTLDQIIDELGAVLAERGHE